MNRYDFRNSTKFQKCMYLTDTRVAGTTGMTGNIDFVFDTQVNVVKIECVWVASRAVEVVSGIAIPHVCRGFVDNNGLNTTYYVDDKNPLSIDSSSANAAFANGLIVTNENPIIYCDIDYKQGIDTIRLEGQIGFLAALANDTMCRLWLNISGRFI